MKKLLCILLLLTLLLGGCALNTDTQPSFNVHFIDVGQADSILLEYDGHYALIDGGFAENGPQIVEYMQALGADSLDLMISTHMHGDHMGGLPTVLQTFPTQRVWRSSRTYYSPAYDEMLYYADQQGISLETPMVGESMFLGDVKIQVLGPISKDYTDLNNTSLVVMATYGNNKFLFTGDMRWEAEKELTEAGIELKADVLKVGHHGSYTSTSYLFLRAVQPDYAVIMCGRNNEYGHPHYEPVSRLRDAEVTIFRTDRLGTVVFSSNGQDIKYSWELETAQPEVNKRG